MSFAINSFFFFATSLPIYKSWPCIKQRWYHPWSRHDSRECFDKTMLCPKHGIVFKYTLFHKCLIVPISNCFGWIKTRFISTLWYLHVILKVIFIKDIMSKVLLDTSTFTFAQSHAHAITGHPWWIICLWFLDLSSNQTSLQKNKTYLEKCAIMRQNLRGELTIDPEHADEPTLAFKNKSLV